MLHCRRVAGVRSLLSIGWWYISSVSPKRHCCRVSAADKERRVYPLDTRPDDVALCSGCTPGKRPFLFSLDRPAHLLPCWTPWCVEAHQDEVFFRVYGTNAAVLGAAFSPYLCPGCKILNCEQFYPNRWKYHKNKITTIKITPTTLSSLSKPKTLISIPISKSLSSTQAQLLPSTSSVTVTLSSKSQLPIPLIDTVPTTSNSLSMPAASSSSTACSVLEATATTSSAIPATSQDTKQTSKPSGRK
ncbi:uncharacterized protein TNCV_1757561 [Trichonephila clavipes]|nr:uncharacterized protein TNCV_1757561 [Trichonephila clavipes]